MATTRFADHLLTGTHASRPSASAVPAGTLYSCTTHALIYQSDGSSTWSTYATLGSTETLPASIIDAKGDLIAGTANDTAARLAVGSDGQVLTADAASTPGVKWAAAGGSGALTLLSTTTLGGAGTFDVSSISGSYNDLILQVIGRGTDAGTVDYLNLKFNNDSGSNYYTGYTLVSGTGTVSGAEQNGAAGARAGRIPCAAAVASSFGSIEITVPGYASTSWLKVAKVHGFAVSALSTGGELNWNGGVLWNNTAAITRVQLAGLSTANLVTGSVLRIYGRL